MQLSSVLRTVGIGLVLIALSGPVYAGNVKVVVSNNWSNIARVEVEWGLNRQYGPKRWSNVSKGKVLGTYADRACYRRSKNPSNANSGLTIWTCQTQTISGTSTLYVR